MTRFIPITSGSMLSARGRKQSARGRKQSIRVSNSIRVGIKAVMLRFNSIRIGMTSFTAQLAIYNPRTLLSYAFVFMHRFKNNLCLLYIMIYHILIYVLAWVGEHFVNFKHYIRVPLPDNNESHVSRALKLLHEALHFLENFPNMPCLKWVYRDE